MAIAIIGSTVFAKEPVLSSEGADVDEVVAVVTVAEVIVAMVVTVLSEGDVITDGDVLLAEVSGMQEFVCAHVSTHVVVVVSGYDSSVVSEKEGIILDDGVVSVVTVETGKVVAEVVAEVVADAVSEVVTTVAVVALSLLSEDCG